MAGKTSRRPARANRVSRETRYAERREAGVPKGKPKGGQQAKRLPMNMDEVKELLTHKSKHPYLRMPIGRSERRYWNKLWQMKGRPFNKTKFKGDSKKRKERQHKNSQKWGAKRRRNNEVKVTDGVE